MSAKRCERDGCRGRAAAEGALEFLAIWEQAGIVTPEHAATSRALLMRAPSVTVRYFWPGGESEPVEACASCAAWARHVAGVIGFKLHEESIVTGEEAGGPSRFQLIEIK